MTNKQVNDVATSSTLAWSSLGGHMQHGMDDEAATDVDEPPDLRFSPSPAQSQFKRTLVPKVVDHSESLLTKALHQSEEDIPQSRYQTLPTRRRSMNSNISLASTADLTSDTGLTSPARTNTPSPPPPVLRLVKLNEDLFGEKRGTASPVNFRRQSVHMQATLTPVQPCSEKREPTAEAPPKKRCISFVCGPNPEAKKTSGQSQPVETTSTTIEKPQRVTCLKFACPAKPGSLTESLRSNKDIPKSSPIEVSIEQDVGSTSTLRKYRSSSANRGRQRRSLTPRPGNKSPGPVQPSKYLTANPGDLNTESARFHEFASDEPVQEDWIRQKLSASARLTINDTLWKENEIRRLGKEAEEEALEEEMEEEEVDVDLDDEETELLDDFDEDEDAEDEEEFDDQSDYEPNSIASDGYNTDNEIGFAESDDEDDADLQLWTPVIGLAVRLSNDLPVYLRASLKGEKSDSSSSEEPSTSNLRRKKTRRIKFRPGTPELPDSTDFVCGTLDEDRVLENAYISCMAVKRREKLHLIPQDIDPSFPNSEPEDEEIESHRRGHDSDEPLWIHGELEDLHHTRDQDGERRKKKTGHTSPKRYRSPPPKGRGRSPRRLFDGHSPRRLMSPPPPGRATLSPPASLVHGGYFQNAHFKTLAFRPGLTHTKSLPRAPAIFPQQIKNQRRMGKPSEHGGHVRGAIDIVKGLEQKRQRRREKFKEKYVQKHNDKARKGQLPQIRPQPGIGAQRMREIGLLSAGLDPDQFVLSV